ncbi:MAG: transporter [Planctomycetota bacterium]
MPRTLSLMTLFALSFASANGQAQRCYSESGGFPRLLFLDDFGKIGRPEAQRDPFEERIETERHDFTQSTRTVGRRVVQIEAGYSYFYKDNRDEIEKSHTTPETLLRLGLTEDIEFRLRYSYGWTFIDEADDQRGSQDLIWSFKLGMTEECGYIPESALELRFSAPTGGSDFSTGRVDHGLDYIFGWELNETWVLYGSAGYVTGALGDFGFVPEEPAEDWFIVWTQSVALSTELTDRTTVYNEFYSLFSYALEDDFAVVFYNIGVDYYLTENFVLDFRIGKGLTPDSDDFFSGIGGGFRF